MHAAAHASRRWMVFILAALGTAAVDLRSSRSDQPQADKLRPLHLPDRIVPNAKLVGLEGNRFVFRTDEQSELYSEAVVRWGVWPGIVGHQAVWLKDGGWVTGQIERIDGTAVQLRNAWLEFGDIPISMVRAIVYTPPASLEAWIALDEWMRRQQVAEPDSDAVWLRDGSLLSGIVDWSSEQGGEEARLEIEIQNRRISIPWREVSVLVVCPSVVGPVSAAAWQAGPHPWIGLEDGTLLNAIRIETAPKFARLETISLGRVTSLDAPSDFAGALRYLSSDEIFGTVRLGSLEPISYRFRPESELEFGLGRDLTVYGKPILIGRRSQRGIVHRGLAMHSSAQVAYRWDQSPGRFLAEARLSEPRFEDSLHGDLVCRVLLGMDGQLREVLRFELSRLLMERSQHLVDVDIRGAQLVILVVEKGRFGPWGDEVFWLDARFHRL